MTKSTKKAARKQAPATAMLLAAGYGKRMRPLTETMPKPMVRVAGQPLVDHVLDKAAEAGIARCVVNVHYLADMLEAHLRGRDEPQIIISDEREALLETGGGVRKALAQLGKEPFYVLNSDSVWIDGVTPLLTRLARAWNPDEMDGLLALANAATGDRLHRAGRLPHGQRGPFAAAPRTPRRAVRVHGCWHPQAGTVRGHPARGFLAEPDLRPGAIEAERLHGLRLDGRWMHVGTPEAIGEAEDAIDDSMG